MKLLIEIDMDKLPQGTVKQDVPGVLSMVSSRWNHLPGELQEILAGQVGVFADGVTGIVWATAKIAGDVQ